MAWNRSIERKEEPKGRPPRIGRGLVAGLIVCLAAVAAFLILRDGGDGSVRDAGSRPQGRIKEVKPAAAPVCKEEPKEDPKAAERKARAEMLKKMTRAERLEYLFEEAKRKPLDLTPSTNRLFNTGTEQIMSWIFTTRLGNPPMPLPKVPIRDEAHLAEILISDNPVFETDSEKAKEAKQTVEAVKKEAIKYIKEGGDIQEFFHYYHDQLMQAYHEYNDAHKSVMEMLRRGEDAELCSAYIRKVNERMAERGIDKRVEIPDKVFERYTGQKQIKTQQEGEIKQ